MGKPIGGTAFIKVDGEQLSLGGSLTVDVMDTEKEGQAGLSGVAGFTENNRVPMIEGDFFVPDTFPIDKLQTMTGATVTAELANGKTAILEGAWLSGTIAINAADGTTSLKFEGVKGRYLS
ncbi:phage tail tube protein [Hwanghaeella sp.]|uniref:phage tail tube protein n=1 Tax=Hwanghaeella sp. TaxID=2605943 RepID=UPI003CCC1658